MSMSGGGSSSSGGMAAPRPGNVRLLWTCVDAATGQATKDSSLSKYSLMSYCGLPSRDLRILDPQFPSPSTILSRDKAIVVNLEKIRCIITADEVFVLNVTNEEDYRNMYVSKLQLKVPFGVESSQKRLPFEFIALEIALEVACEFLDCEAREFKDMATELMNKVTSNISANNLDGMRQLKNDLNKLTRRVKKVRVEIEELLNDDGDMAEMYLTEKKRKSNGGQSQDEYEAVGHGHSVSGSVSPSSSPPQSTEKLQKPTRILRGSQESTDGTSETSSERTVEDVSEVEMLLENYCMVLYGVLNELKALREYINYTDDFLTAKLDNARNQLLRFQLVILVAEFAIAFFGMVTGIFGMQFAMPIYNRPSVFLWVLILDISCFLVIFVLSLVFFKYKGVIYT